MATTEVRPTVSATSPAMSRSATSTARRRRVRPAHAATARLHRRLGGEPAASGRTPSSTGSAEAPGTVVVVDPLRTDRGARRPAPPAFPGSDAALAFALMHVLRARRPDRPRLHRAPHRRLGRARATAGRLHAGVGRAMTGVPAADIEQAAPLYGAGPSCCGSARACSASRPAAMSCGPARSCRPSPATWAKPGAGFLYLNSCDRSASTRRALTAAPEPRRAAICTWTWPTCSPTRPARTRSSAGT